MFEWIKLGFLSELKCPSWHFSVWQKELDLDDILTLEADSWKVLLDIDNPYIRKNVRSIFEKIKTSNSFTYQEMHLIFQRVKAMAGLYKMIPNFVGHKISDRKKYLKHINEIFEKSSMFPECLLEEKYSSWIASFEIHKKIKKEVFLELERRHFSKALRLLDFGDFVDKNKKSKTLLRTAELVVSGKNWFNYNFAQRVSPVAMDLSREMRRALSLFMNRMVEMVVSENYFLNSRVIQPYLGVLQINQELIWLSDLMHRSSEFINFFEVDGKLFNEWIVSRFKNLNDFTRGDKARRDLLKFDRIISRVKESSEKIKDNNLESILRSTSLAWATDLSQGKNTEESERFLEMALELVAAKRIKGKCFLPWGIDLNVILVANTLLDALIDRAVFLFNRNDIFGLRTVMKEIRHVGYILKLTEEIPEESNMHPEGLLRNISGNWPRFKDNQYLCDFVTFIWKWDCAEESSDKKELLGAGRAAKVLLDSLRIFKTSVG